jgi:hypothetical protein
MKLALSNVWLFDQLRIYRVGALFMHVGRGRYFSYCIEEGIIGSTPIAPT